jgi:hypothetical protein
MADKAVRYAGFISYRHKPRDRQWALRVMHWLETFRTPKALQAEGFPDRIGTLFRDEDEIPASSDLSDQIKQALARSDFLIVICSPDTPSSRWVRREIELFQELGKGERILAVLIAGEPDESFPPELRRRRVARTRPDGESESVWEEVEPIAADVRPRSDERRSLTERRALLRLTSTLLGCRFDDLARRDEQRRRAALRVRASMAAAALGAICAGSVWYWDAFVRIKTEHCASIAERWGVPSCVGAIEGDVWRRRQSTWRLLRRAGQVLEMTRINGSGHLQESPETRFSENEGWTEGAARWVFTFSRRDPSGEARLSSAALYDRSGELVRRIEFQFSEDGQQAITRFDKSLGMADRQRAAASGLAMSADDRKDGGRADIGQHRLFFRSDGLLERRIFEPVGGGVSVGDALGVHGRSYEYNELGLPSRIRNLDVGGRTLPDQAGAASVRREYDGRARLVLVEWQNASGMPVRNADLFASAALERDGVGNVAEIRLRDASGKPTLSKKDGYASMRRRYDERGNAIEHSFHGLNEELVPQKDLGAPIIRFTFDDRGNRIEGMVYGVDELPMLGKSGTFRSVRKHDRFGNVIEEAYFGKDGRRAIRRPDGVAGYTYAFDDQGRFIGRGFFGLDGKPALRQDEGWAISRHVLDAQSRIVEVSYFGPDGQPILDKRLGAARYTNAFDQRGNVVKVCYFGTDGTPILHKAWGVACRTWQYDSTGNIVDTTSLGPDGARILSADEGETRIVYKRDDRGQVVEQGYLGLNDEPVLSRVRGAARVTSRYDDRGNEIEQTHFGLDGGPVANNEGIHREVRRFDERNALIERSRYGVDGNPIGERKTGIARLVYRRDDRGNIIEEQYYGADGQPVLRRDWGAARVVWRHDDRDRMTEIAFFGFDNRPIATADLGVARIVYSYDQIGNRLERRSFGTDGKPVADKRDGMAVDLFEYDAYGRMIGRKLLGVDEQPVLHKRWGFAGGTMRYDERGNNVEEIYFGLDGRPIVPALGYARRTYRFNERGNIIEQAYFDANGNPTPDKTYAVPRFQRDYDGHGRIVEERFYGASGELDHNAFGFARSVAERNSAGLLVRETYFDRASLPTLRHNKYIQDEEIAEVVGGWKRYVVLAALEPTSRAGLGRGGFARIEQQHDARGLLTWRAFFGLAGEPVNGPDGFSLETVRYDTLGRPTQFEGRRDASDQEAAYWVKAVFTHDVYGAIAHIRFVDGAAGGSIERTGIASIEFESRPNGRGDQVVYKGPDGSTREVR